MTPTSRNRVGNRLGIRLANRVANRFGFSAGTGSLTGPVTESLTESPHVRAIASWPVPSCPIPSEPNPGAIPPNRDQILNGNHLRSAVQAEVARERALGGHDPMNEPWHRISDVDPEARRGVCSVCGTVRLRRRVRNGSTEWSCGVKHREQAGVGARPHRKIIRERNWCSRCGFTAAHPSQLDVHHLDGDHSNNVEDNLEVLCANCHRLEHVSPDGPLDHSFTARDIQSTITITGLMEFICCAGLALPDDTEVERLAAKVATRNAAEQHTNGAAA